MPRTTRKTREQQLAAGIEPSPLKSIPQGTQPKKPRGNATEKRSPSPPQRSLRQSQGDVNTSSPSQSPQPHESRSQSPQVAESRSTSPPQQRTRSYNLRTASRSVSPGHQTAVANKVIKKPQQPRGKKAPGPRASSRVAASRKPAAPKATAGASRPRRHESFTPQSVDKLAVVGQSPNKQSSLKLPGSFPEVDQHIINSIEQSHPQTPASTSRLTSTRTKRTRESSTHRGVDSTDDESTHRPIIKRSRLNIHTPAQESVRYHEASSAYSPLATLSSPPISAFTPSQRINNNKNKTSIQGGASLQDDSNFDVNDIEGIQSTPRIDLASSPRQHAVAQPKVASHEEVNSKINVGERRPTEARITPASKPVARQNSTCPPLDRGTTAAEDFGFQKPSPQSIVRQRQARVGPILDPVRYRRKSLNLDASDEEDGSDVEYDGGGYTQEEMRAANQHIREARREAKHVLHSKLTEHFSSLRAPRPLPPKSKNTANHTSEQGQAPSRSRTSTSIYKSDLIIPASLSGERMILTDSQLIDAVRSVVVWATSNSAYKVPDAEQMTALLEQHNAQEVTKVAAAHQPSGVRPTSNKSSTVDNTNDHVVDQNGADDVTSGTAVVTMSGGLGDQENADTEDTNEVQVEVKKPLTPAHQPSPRATGAHSWIEAAKNLVKTPLSIFGRSQQAATTPTANIRPETEFTFKHTSNVPELPQSPTPNTRPAKAHSERKAKGGLNMFGTPHKFRTTSFGKDLSIPIQERGRISAERIKQIQDEQDARKAAGIPEPDIFGGARRQKRNAQFATVEDCPEEENDCGSPATTGNKRKRGEKRPPSSFGEVPSSWSFANLSPQIPIAKEPAVEEPFRRTASGIIITNLSGTFKVPSPTASDFEDDEEDAIDRDSQATMEETPNGPNVGRRVDDSPIGSRDKHFDLSTIPEEQESSIIYEGTIFRQPALVQANINQGLSPLAPRSSFKILPDTKSGNKNLFNQFDSSPKALSEPKTSAPNADKLPRTGYGFSYSDCEDSDSDESGDGSEVESTPTKSLRNMNDGSNVDNTSTKESLQVSNDGSNVDNTSTKESLQVLNDGAVIENTIAQSPQEEQSSSVLQPKQWDQTPPPKAPRPSNAQLPQPSAAEVAIANVHKYQPKKPSGLRNVSIMSPLQIEQEQEGATAAEDTASPPLIGLDTNDVDITMAELSDWAEVEEAVGNVS